MVNDPLFLNGNSISTVVNFFKHMSANLYFNRYEGIKDLIEELKYNMDHTFAYRDKYVALQYKEKYLAHNLLFNRCETE